MGIEATLTRVLAEHDDPPGWTSNDVDSPVYECNCGDQSPALPRDYIGPEDAEAASEWHRAHVAAALTAALRDDETLVERVAEAITRRWIDGYDCTNADLAHAAVAAMLGGDQ